MIRRIPLYANLSDDEFELIDDVIYLLDYESKTEFVTALIHAAVYGTEIRTYTRELNAVFPCYTSLQKMKGAFFSFLDETAIPILARHGAEKTYEFLHDDAVSRIFDICRTIPRDEDLREWMKTYAAMNRGSIISHQLELETERYKEQQKGEQKNRETQTFEPDTNPVQEGTS